MTLIEWIWRMLEERFGKTRAVVYNFRVNIER
jgi:hypothetical protein